MSDNLARKRREHIKAGMKHAWKGYKDHAFGHDEVTPLSGRSRDNWGGLGTTLVDSLDTLWLMNMKDEFCKGAAPWQIFLFGRTFFDIYYSSTYL